MVFTSNSGVTAQLEHNEPFIILLPAKPATVNNQNMTVNIIAR